MLFKKLQATQLFDGYRFRENAVLVLKDDQTVEDIIPLEEAGDELQQVEGILSPGFVNCHCHLELSHLKSQIPEHTGLAGFVQQVVQKRNFPEETILQAIADADAEMAANGIVAVGDICNSPHTLQQKQKSGLYYHNFIEVLGANPQMAEKNFDNFEKVFQLFAHVFPGQTSMVPHAPYSLSDTLWNKVLAHDKSGLLSIHNQETDDENRWFREKSGGFVNMFEAMGVDTSGFKASGKSSLQSYLPTISADRQLLLIHNVFTRSEDIEAAEASHAQLFWCFCANANHYISRLLPDLPVFRQKNVKIVIGTDSLASNHQLNIWSEIETLHAAFPAIPLEEMLQWATINGARALQIESVYGSFEKGKKPGLVLINQQGASRFRV